MHGRQKNGVNRVTSFTLKLSDQPVITVPADVAHQAGLEEGQIQIILGKRSLTLVPHAPATDYTAHWDAVAATLREQAAQFDLVQEDRRDETYWDIVAPLFEETERTIGSS